MFDYQVGDIVQSIDRNRLRGEVLEIAEELIGEVGDIGFPTDFVMVMCGDKIYFEPVTFWEKASV